MAERIDRNNIMFMKGMRCLHGNRWACEGRVVFMVVRGTAREATACLHGDRWAHEGTACLHGDGGACEGTACLHGDRWAHEGTACVLLTAHQPVYNVSSSQHPHQPEDKAFS